MKKRRDKKREGEREEGGVTRRKGEGEEGKAGKGGRESREREKRI